MILFNFLVVFICFLNVFSADFYSKKQPKTFEKISSFLVQNKITNFLDYSDLNSLKLTSKTNQKLVNNSKNTKQEINKLYHSKTNLKTLLTTTQGITFLKTLKKHENKKLWRIFINKNDIKTLQKLKEIGIKMKLSNDELLNITKSFYSVHSYETIEFLIDYIKLNDVIAKDLFSKIFKFLYHLRTPTTTKQQNIQLEIIKKLIQYQSVKDLLNFNFYNVIWSLNIQLVDFVIKELKININELKTKVENNDGEFIFTYNGLQVVIEYLNFKQNKNNTFAYEMFDYLLSIGVNISKRDSNGQDVYCYMNRISDNIIKNELELIIKKYNSSSLGIEY